MSGNPVCLNLWRDTLCHRVHWLETHECLRFSHQRTQISASLLRRLRDPIQLSLPRKMLVSSRVEFKQPLTTSLPIWDKSKLDCWEKGFLHITQQKVQIPSSVIHPLRRFLHIKNSTPMCKMFVTKDWMNSCCAQEQTLQVLCTI